MSIISGLVVLRQSLACCLKVLELDGLALGA